MAHQTFQVASIKSRDVTTKFGQKKAYDLFDTTGNKYGFGFTDPATRGINVGSFVTGDVTVDKFGAKLDGKACTVASTGTVSAVADVGSASAPSSGGGKKDFVPKVFPVPATHGDMAIIRQNALSNATAMVSDFVATLPAEKFPAIDAWTDMIIDVAYKFTKFSSGHREAEAIARLSGAGVPGTDISAALSAQVGNDEG